MSFDISTSPFSSREEAIAVAEQIVNPFKYLTECCYTRDEVAVGRPDLAVVRLLPPLPHIEWFCKVWISRKLIVTCKSRRMQFSWSACALEDWLCNFSEQAHVAVVAQDQVASEKFLGRHVFIHEKLPPILRRPLKIWKGNQGDPKKIEYLDTGSTIEAFSSEPEKFRGEGLTLVRMEEVQSWDEGHPNRSERAWRAIRPVTQGGGRIVIIGTPLAGSWYERVVKDQLDVQVGK
jgi:hypothetical protein